MELFHGVCSFGQGSGQMWLNVHLDRTGQLKDAVSHFFNQRNLVTIVTWQLYIILVIHITLQFLRWRGYYLLFRSFNLDRTTLLVVLYIKSGKETWFQYKAKNVFYSLVALLVVSVFIYGVFNHRILYSFLFCIYHKVYFLFCCSYKIK